METIKSPLNYTGGKYSLLGDIHNVLPKEVGIFVDLFCGGCNVAVNVEAETIICNDKMPEIVHLYKGLQQQTGQTAVAEVLGVVDKYGLSKTNAEGFYACREAYNKEKTWVLLYACITHAFNYQIRFNQNGGYNMPFGKDRSSFNPALQERLGLFTDRLKNLRFESKDFEECINQLGEEGLLREDTVVYCDPPYLISTATYNESGGWGETEERRLYAMLDELNKKGVKFVLSNVVEHKGQLNNILKDWMQKYTVQYVGKEYSNCSYHKKEKTAKTQEVLVYNY